MKEIKHTKGPWYWDDRYPKSSDGEKTWSLIGADGYGILSCDGVENSPQGLNDHGNANLIAAAPDLLYALELVKVHLSEPECAIWRYVHAVMDAAIAKAAGI